MSEPDRRRSCQRAAWALLLVALALVAGVAGRAQDGPTPTGTAILLSIEGAIGPATASYVGRGLETATTRKAAAVILRMDTPGGLDSAMRDIIRDILASSVPVISYVTPSGARAASAGTYILYASHVAAMAPSTNLGAATPIQLGGGGLPGSGKDKQDEKDKDKEKDKGAPADAAGRKAVNDAVAYIRGLATLRGRNADWAEKAVREAASLPATEARAQQVIDFIATDLQDLLNKADGRTVKVAGGEHVLKTAGAAVEAVEPDWRERILATITNPNIAYILLLIGIYGLIFEFVSPGSVGPGVIGAIALLVGLYALNLLPINYAGVALLAVGVALMIAEALVPSFGILGFGGIVAFVVGSLFLFETDVPGFTLSWQVIALATIATAAFLIIAVAVAWRAHRRKVAIGDSTLVGRSGRVLKWNGTEGQVHVFGERWQARSHLPLQPGQSVRVVARSDLTLVVEPEAQASPQP